LISWVAVHRTCTSVVSICRNKDLTVCTDFTGVDVRAVLSDVRVVGIERAESGASIRRNLPTALACNDNVRRRAILACDAEAERLAKGKVRAVGVDTIRVDVCELVAVKDENRK
jgi:hypothetical protein